MLLVLLLAYDVAAFFPFFNGARDLALAQSALTFTYDFQVCRINPALLSGFSTSLQGLSYQQNYGDWGGILEKSKELFEKNNLKNWDSFSNEKKASLWSSVQSLYNQENFFQGFVSKGAGFASGKWSLNYFNVHWSWLKPKPESLENIDAEKNPGYQELALLKFLQFGARFSQVVLAYSFGISSNIDLGFSVNYLKGRVLKKEVNFLDFAGEEVSKRVFLENGWDFSEGEEISKIYIDTGLLFTIGRSLKAALVVKGVGKPALHLQKESLTIENQISAGISFHPDESWGIYFSALLKPSDLFFTGVKQQPVALGVEKSFFESKLFLRAGIRGDLQSTYLTGSNSPLRVSFGAGLNIAPLVADIALIMNSRRQLDGLALNLIILNR